MKYENTKEYPCGKFRRMCGMKKKTFEKAVEIPSAKHAAEHAKNVRKSGRKPKLCMEDKLLATLEYLWECRTMAHIAASYGIAESNIHTTIRWVENTLAKDGIFSLPGKKALAEDAGNYELVLVDAIETPIERPKKTAEVVFRREKAAHGKNAGRRMQAEPQDNMRGVRKREAAWFQAFQGIESPHRAGSRGHDRYGVPGDCENTREFRAAEETFQAQSFGQRGQAVELRDFKRAHCQRTRHRFRQAPQDSFRKIQGQAPQVRAEV